MVKLSSGRQKTAGKLQTGTSLRALLATNGRPLGSKICQPSVPPRCQTEPYWRSRGAHHKLSPRQGVVGRCEFLPYEIYGLSRSFRLSNSWPPNCERFRLCSTSLIIRTNFTATNGF
jgi:hypothetical protein